MKRSFSPHFFILAKISQLLFVFSLYFVLCFIYTEVVVPRYSFGGFEIMRMARHELAMPPLLLFSLFVPSQAKDIRSLFLIISLFFLILPLSVLCSLQDSNFNDYIIMLFFTLVTCWGSFFIDFIFKRKSGSLFEKKRIKINFWMPFSVLLLVVIYLGMHVGFSITTSFSDVYERRFLFNDSLNFPLNYLFPFAAGPLSAFLAALAIYQKKWWNLLCVLLCTIFLFAFSTHKSSLLAPLFAIIIFASIRMKIGFFYVIYILISTVSIIILLDVNAFDGALAGIFANRLMFIPSQIHYVFFDQFYEIGYLYWAESKISMGLVESHLPIPSVNYIAQLMTGDDKIGANVGWLANGYMNAGVLGVFIYSLILSALMNLIDWFAEKINPQIIITTFSIPMFSIVTSNDLLVAILTGGIFLMIILLLGLTANKYGSFRLNKLSI